MTNLNITISTNAINGMTHAYYRLGNAMKEATEFIPSFSAGVNAYTAHKKAKYLQRYHRRGERMKKVGKR